jgi:hypothetical protein
MNSNHNSFEFDVERRMFDIVFDLDVLVMVTATRDTTDVYAISEKETEDIST